MSQKKKLAILINNLGYGGAQKIASVLAKELLDTFEIYIVLMNNQIVYDLPDNIKIEMLSSGRERGLIRLIKNVKRYHHFCKLNKIDVSLSILTQPNYINSLTKVIGSKTKIVLSEHTYQSLWRKNEWLYSRSKRLIISLLYNRADKIITVSNKIRIDLEKNFRVKKDKLCTVFNPYPIKTINELSKEPVEEISQSNNFTFITVGTLYHVKNQELLLKSFANLPNKNSQLIIVGDGELRGYLEKLSEKLGIHNRVNFIGFTNNPFKYIGISDVFVLSSNNEGLPNVIIEALSCGCPVISTDCISGPREILAPKTSIDMQLKNNIQFEEYGVLVPIKNENLLAEAMNSLMTNQSLLNSYKEKALDRALFFDTRSSIDGYLGILNNN